MQPSRCFSSSHSALLCSLQDVSPPSQGLCHCLDPRGGCPALFRLPSALPFSVWLLQLDTPHNTDVHSPPWVQQRLLRLAVIFWSSCGHLAVNKKGVIISGSVTLRLRDMTSTRRTLPRCLKGRFSLIQHCPDRARFQQARFYWFRRGKFSRCVTMWRIRKIQWQIEIRYMIKASETSYTSQWSRERPNKSEI